MQIKNKNFNIPNALTVLRMILVIPFMICYLNGYVKTAVVVLVIAGLTDALDGFVARHFNQFTELGQVLDPISDKLTQGAVAISLAVRHPVLLPFLMIFVVKECIMLVAGGVLLKKGKKPCAAKWYGKLATVLFYVTFVTIMLMDMFRFYHAGTAAVMLLITAAFMILALVLYAREFFRILKSNDPEDQIDLAEMMDKKKRLKKE
ncbi:MULTISPECIES: CDP-alcohol phosphatidyltransferase family protein [Caproicibacterium]|uniref:CDP-diacylglycerol--glycerol-3-phosphate 3-phosphatidyltransferase n=1 Tax=Caproicibacterium argilliputei TaxID=3030016 RepID=A0AA97H1U6_9FIRM|nr:CDP-alcohol phosphatidyltransferase family protein [Caproicibacterium argilliputei]WOC31667.1 CDP-alcohol phosphatidyltransferase family protein [Caproicibacterium argilliputei]